MASGPEHVEINQAMLKTGAMLQRLARDKSETGRSALVEAVINLPLSSNDDLKVREKDLVFEILSDLVHETEMSVRATISARLCEMTDAPPDLIRFLANDEIEIAHPILSKSRVLEDKDLIAIIESRTIEHQLSIAIRQKVGATVSAALVKEKNTNVIECLLENSGAEITPVTMQRLVNLSEHESRFRGPIVHRHDLGEALAQRMFAWVSGALRDVLVQDWSFSAELVDTLLKKASLQDSAMLRNRPQSPTVKMAKELAKRGLLSPQTLLRVLRSGDVSLFVAILQLMTELPESFVRRLVHDKIGMGLAVLCKSCSMSREVFGAVFALTRADGDPLKVSYRNVLEYYENISDEKVAELIDFWRNHSNLSELWELHLDLDDSN
ncbi:MAG: DUF2336 domain-containing protein [Alphaproteobacteria bacterium]|nr:DUF2336 domain-containing protein [Alphaproteobacteria bacterium]